MVSKYVNDTVAGAYGRWAGLTDITDLRAGFDAMLPAAGGDVTARADTVGGVPGEWITVPGSGSATILYLHGGGYFVGSAAGYRGLASRVAGAAGARAFVADYRLAPEHRFPAAFDDALAVYRGLIASGVDPAEIAVVGDSAGGGLALALLVALRDAGDPLPAAVSVMSPMVDHTISGDTYDSLQGIDPLINKDHAAGPSAMYRGELDPADVRVSPVFADLTGLPPLQVQVGSTECLLADALRIAENARRAGVAVDLHVAYEMVHVYQMFPDEFPQAAQDIADVGRFVREHTAR